MTKKMDVVQSSGRLSPASVREVAMAFKSDKEDITPLTFQQNFIICNADIAFDLRQKDFVFLNEEFLFTEYHKKLRQMSGEYTYSDDEIRENFQTERNFLLSEMKKVAQHILQERHESLDDLVVDERDFFCPAAATAKASADESENEEICFAYSPQRNMAFNAHFENFVRSMLIDIVMKQALGERYQIIPAKFSKDQNGAKYLRDDLIIVGGNIYMIDPMIVDEMSDSGQFEENLTKVKSKSVSFHDVTAAGFPVKGFTPFILEGGNVIACEDRKLLLVSLSNFDFTEEHNADGTHSLIWNGSFIVDERQEVIEGDYQECRDLITKWGNALGYQVLIVDRQVSDENPLEDLYHLDTFLAVVGKFLLLPQEEIITPETRENLVRIFGQENIIPLSAQDRKALASNLIVTGNQVSLGSKDVSLQLIEDLTQRGFTVFKPKIHLGFNHDDALRCHTQVIRQSEKPAAAIAVDSSHSVFEKLQISPIQTGKS